MAKQSLATRATKPMVLTKLMLVGGAHAAPTGRPPTPASSTRTSTFPRHRRRRAQGLVHPAARATGPGPVVVFVHGWLWNRLGNVAGRVPFTDRDVDFLPATKALHDAGYHVLLFDLRHHGESGRGRAPLTYGPREARDCSAP